MHYRTRTYIAADWTGDKKIVDKLREWNQSGFYALDYTDAHDLMQSRDTSLPCTIKKSLSERLNASKTFVLIVGKDTKSLTKGSCRYCTSYTKYINNCGTDNRSFIEYECEKAVKDQLKIVVIYNYANVDRSKCPECIRYQGTHITAYFKGADGQYYWNISEISKAINN